MIKSLKIVGTTICILGALYGTVYAGLRTFSSDPLVYSIQPFTLDKMTYHYGDDMIITSYRCNYDGQPLVVETITRDFYNLSTGQTYKTSAGTGVVQPGCAWADAFAPNAFPKDMPSGVYIKRGVTEAHGRWRTIQVPWQTQRFTYVAND